MSWRSEDQVWRDAVQRGARVQLHYAHNFAPCAQGRIVAYSSEPQVFIQTDDGRDVWWMASLTTELPDETEPLLWNGDQA